MNCHDVRETLEGYIAGDLEDREASEVARHLDACPACAAAYEETRLLVGGAEGPERRLPPGAAGRRRLREPRGVAGAAAPPPLLAAAWVLAAAVLLVVLAGAVAVATVPSLARTVPLPVGAQLNDLQQENELMREQTRAMEERVRALEERIKSLTGDDVNVVPTSEQEIPDEVTMAVQQVVIQFIKAQYAGDLERLKALSTPALDARIDERPEDYLRDNAGTVSFAQMTDVSLDPDGLYLTFVRLSDTKVFSDSQYQENFAVEKAGDRYLVEYMETDA